MSHVLITKDDLPKGMEPSEAPGNKKPAPLDLGQGNYAGAIRQALAILPPVEIRIDRCVILEQHGKMPQVKLSLTILGEKEGYRERNRAALESAVEDLRAEGP